MFEYKDVCEVPSNVDACISYGNNPLLTPASAVHQKVKASGRFDRLSPYHHKTNAQKLNDESCSAIASFTVLTEVTTY